MHPRFVLEEYSWHECLHRSDLEMLIDRLLDRIETAKDRSELVARFDDFLETSISDHEQILSLMYVDGVRSDIDHDVKTRLSLTLDRLAIVGTQSAHAGTSRTALYAVSLGSAGWCVALLPLPVEDLHSVVAIGPGPGSRLVHIVSSEREHVQFFRSVIDDEDANEQAFAILAHSAFPDLQWVDRIWNELSAFSVRFRERRDELTKCLSGLNDWGAVTFARLLNTTPQELAATLSAHIGFATSDENGKAKSNRKAREERTRIFEGTAEVFWWHAKLLPHKDRVHFLYQPSTDATQQNGRIVVGVFAEHCFLP